MKIVEAEALSINIPVKKALRGRARMAFWGIIKDIPITIIRITADNGAPGYGEAPKTMPSNLLYSGESHETDRIIFDRYIRKALIGEDPLNTERIYERMNAITADNWMLKGAVDMAIYDLVGKLLMLPVYALLGGKYRDKFQVSISVPHLSHEEGVKWGEEWVGKGWKIIKVKVGRSNPNEDVEMVRGLREAIGNDVSLRIDANQGYSVKTAIRTIKKMDKYDLAFAEQPTSRWDLEGMAEIAKGIDIPVMADESVDTPQDVCRIIKTRAAQLLSIGVFKGGITLPRKMIVAAEAAGLECYLGGTYGTAIGTAASAHITVALKNVTYGFEALGPIPYLEGDIVKGDFLDIFNYKDGYMSAPEKPGLGLEIDEEKIKKYSMNL